MVHSDFPGNLLNLGLCETESLVYVDTESLHPLYVSRVLLRLQFRDYIFVEQCDRLAKGTGVLPNLALPKFLTIL